MTIDISIVIPTYNQKPGFLTEAIESALHQTYPKDRYEILVVDDGSLKILPDSVMRMFPSNEKLRFIKKEHGGAAHTLNTGIAQMHGKYFKWLSSDDALCEDALEILMANVSDKPQIVYGNWIAMDEKSRMHEVLVEASYSDLHEMRHKLWINFYGNATASLIPKSAFKSVGLFDSSLPYYEDYDWWLRAVFLHNFQLSNCNELVAKYRFHQNQLTSQLSRRDVQKLLCRWRIKRRIYEKLDQTMRVDAVPKPSISSLTKRMFISDTAYLFRKIAGSTQNGRARTPAKFRNLMRNFLKS